MSRTRDARPLKASTSSRCRPNSLTSIAPETLNRSVICVFNAALSPICSREMSCSRTPTRRAGIMNTGNTTSDSTVSRHSSASIAPSVVTNTTTFDTTLPSVPVTAVCAPTTSLFSRLISAPVCVRVKKAIGMFCTLSNNATRKSYIRPSPIRDEYHRCTIDKIASPIATTTRIIVRMTMRRLSPAGMAVSTMVRNNSGGMSAITAETRIEIRNPTIEFEYGRANTTTRRIDVRFTLVPTIADLSPGMR